MKTKRNGGFTIVEILVAIMVLTVGLLALVSTAATVTRMIGQGQRYTRASTMALQRFELLRAQDCNVLVDGSETVDGYTVEWTVTTIAGGDGREIDVTVTSPTTRGTRQDRFTSTRLCS